MSQGYEMYSMEDIVNNSGLSEIGLVEVWP